VKKIGIVVKADPEARKKAEELVKWLGSRNVDIINCIFVLGGDGTFLSAVRWIGNHDIPILGVKFGDVGFLAETAEDRLFGVAEKILKEKITTQARMRLLVRVTRNEKERAAETVLNDVVINKGALARLASIETHINGLYLTVYRADGLIVATPTGSTAYSLAAGGPVIHPAVPAMVMTPICPFTLTNRPLIIPDSSVINLKLEKGSSDIRLTFDGQKGLDIDDKDTIIINKSVHPIRMITLPDQDYFDVLKAKLRWSGGRV
jgi:NAD+ kinase